MAMKARTGRTQRGATARGTGGRGGRGGPGGPTGPTRAPVTGEERVVRPGFRARVYAAVKKVPRGKVTTYGDVAGALGSRRVARQVGFALAALDAAGARVVPWQRVINAQGRISYKGDLARAEVQRQLLEREGLSFDDSGRVIDFEEHRHAFPTPRARSSSSSSRTRSG